MAETAPASRMIACAFGRGRTVAARQKVAQPWHHPILEGYGGRVTAQPAEPPAPARNRPAKTLDDVVRVMTGDVDADFRERFQLALKKAWATARAESSLAPLTSLVEAWWPIACRWADSAAARAYYAELDQIIRDGVPEKDRGNALDAVAKLRAMHGPHPAFDKLENLAARY